MSQIRSQRAQQAAFSVEGTLEIGAYLLCAATLGGFLARFWWVLELMTHFRLLLTLGLVCLALVWLRKHRWFLASACGACGAIDGLLVLSVVLPVEPLNIETGENLRLVSLNVQTENKQYDKVLGFVQRANADLVLFMEVDDAWMTAMQPLRVNYPHVIAETRDDNFGIALFSRLQLTSGETLTLGHAQVPSISALISVGGKNIFVLGTHPLPPGSAEYARMRNEQLQSIAVLVRSRNLPSIVLGDLNCTPLSPYFNDLLRDSGLKNVSPKRGLFGSWPAGLPIARIALDHGLVSPPIQVLDKRLGPNVGSDHLPLILQLKIPTSSPIKKAPNRVA